MRNSTKTMMLSLPELSNARNLRICLSDTMAWTNGAPSLCTSMNTNALETTQPVNTMSAPTHGPYIMRRRLGPPRPNEGDDDLKKLDGEQDEETHGTCLAHIVDDAVEPAGLEDLVNVKAR